jgi:hypothetical protein
MPQFQRLALTSATVVAFLVDPVAAEAKGENEQKDEVELEPRWEIVADVVRGATTTEVLSASRPARIDLPATGFFDSTRISASSFLIGLERRFGERLALGVRVPLVEAELTSRAGIANGRRVFAAGNMELGAGYGVAKGKWWDIVASLEIALPTSGGAEEPAVAEVLADPSVANDYSGYDRLAALQAASAVRGSYEAALFEPRNLGIVPKLTANFRMANLTVSPMVKVENMLDVSSPGVPYIRELVAGVHLSYRVVPALEPGVHLWMREFHEHHHSVLSTSIVGVVEPYVRVDFEGVPALEGVTPTVSAILPFVGGLKDDNSFGVRLSIAGEL